MTIRSLRSIYELKVTLLGIRPPVWRRLQVASTDSLADLHVALQVVMGWANVHMHQFMKDDLHYGEPEEEFSQHVRDEAEYRLDQILKNEKDTLLYLYDFGDCWEHQIVLEKILPFTTDITLPVCIKGRRACPPEDVGGVGGYGMFLDAINDPSHPESEGLIEWIGGDYDPEYFDLPLVNDLLQDYCN